MRVFWTEEYYDLIYVLKTLFRGFPDGSVVNEETWTSSICGPGRSHIPQSN